LRGRYNGRDAVTLKRTIAMDVDRSVTPARMRDRENTAEPPPPPTRRRTTPDPFITIGGGVCVTVGGCQRVTRSPTDGHGVSRWQGEHLSGPFAGRHGPNGFVFD
jgi:hypothetical protein